METSIAVNDRRDAKAIRDNVPVEDFRDVDTAWKTLKLSPSQRKVMKQALSRFVNNEEHLLQFYTKGFLRTNQFGYQTLEIVAVTRPTGMRNDKSGEPVGNNPYLDHNYQFFVSPNGGLSGYKHRLFGDSTKLSSSEVKDILGGDRKMWWDDKHVYHNQSCFRGRVSVYTGEEKQ